VVANSVLFVEHETQDKSHCDMQSILPVGGGRGNITTTQICKKGLF